MMRQRLHFVLMAVPAIAISFLLTTPSLRAGTGSDSHVSAGEIVGVQRNGRTVYENDVATPVRRMTPRPQPSQATGARLMYWSTTEHRWKTVPSASHYSMRAARSAAAEVRSMLNAAPAPKASTTGEVAAPADINAAIEQAAARHNVDPNLVRAVIKVESNFNPHAVSRTGAMGLMQLMPVTARQLNVTNPFDPEQNVDAGVRHLRHLLDNFGGDVRLTLAAYNAGVGAVMRNSGVPPYSETRNYVKKITRLYWSGKSGSGAGMFIVPSRDPVRVYRDAQGVITMTNTD
ncbi:MAG TPA: lytic transglycosylase domain-containing protein [Terriglobales bacterium]|nr:lytic transglycosylase domain-containing protein [Terriglobales bacterium]